MLTSGNKTKRYVYQEGFKIDKPMREALDELAEKKRVKRSVLIRQAVKLLINTEYGRANTTYFPTEV